MIFKMNNNHYESIAKENRKIKHFSRSLSLKNWIRRDIQREKLRERSNTLDTFR